MIGFPLFLFFSDVAKVLECLFLSILFFFFPRGLAGRALLHFVPDGAHPCAFYWFVVVRSEVILRASCV